MTDNYSDLEKDLEREDCLEDQLEREGERLDIQRISSEILFSVQGLGAIREVETETGRIETYVKGQHCEVCLKDLCKACKRDEPERPISRVMMAKWRVLQKDLINLLTCYPQDKVLTYYVVILLESLTNTAPLEFAQRVDDKDIVLEALQEYKTCFLRPMVLETLMNHFADCVSVANEQRSKVHNQMVELIVLIFKNLLQIPDYVEHHNFSGHLEVRKNLQRNLIEMFIRESVLAGLIYISQDFTSANSVTKKLSITLVEIFYRIFTAFDQEWLLRDATQDQQHYTKLAVQEHAKKNRLMVNLVPPRHSRFAGVHLKQRRFDHSCQVYSQPFQSAQVNYNPRQRHKPVLKSIPLKHRTIFVKKLDLQNDPQQKRSLKDELGIFAIDFMQHCFSRLVEAVEDDIAKESERLDTNDKVHYFVLIAYFLKFTSMYCRRNIEQHVKQQNSELSSEFVYVAAALQITQFELIYANMLKESTQIKKRFFNYRNFFSVCTVMLEFLHIVRDLSLSTQSVDRKNAQILMQNIFQHDISKTLRIGFAYCVYGLFDDELLKTIVQLTSLFFDMLESYSQGKTLAIKTNKLLKKKIQKQMKKQQQTDQDQQQQSDKESDSNETDDDDEPIYKERKFNLMSEFAIVVEYGVVEKIFYLLKGDKIFSNTNELNTAIYKYCQRVIDLLSAEWLFFQLDFLTLINSLLSRQEIIIRNDFRNLVSVFRRISRSFILFLNKNKLLGVEALFRFPDSHTKDQILMNYPEETIQKPTEQQQQDDYVQLTQQKQQHISLWSRQEDEALIETYERFRECDNPEEQLCLYLGSIGFSVKSPNEVRKRIKKYRLAKSTPAEIQLKYQQVHDKMQLRKDELLEDSLRELIELHGRQLTELLFDDLLGQIRLYLTFRQNEPFEIPIPPLSQQQFDFFEKTHTQDIFACLELKPPGQGEVYWRVPSHTQLKDIDDWKELLGKAIETAADPNRVSERKRIRETEIIPTLDDNFVPRHRKLQKMEEEEEEEHYVPQQRIVADYNEADDNKADDDNEESYNDIFD